MGMKQNRMANTASMLSPANLRLGLGMFSAALCLSLMPTAASAQVTPQQAKNRCYQYFNSVQNLQELAYNQNALVATRRCIELGIDPPMKMRPNYGRSPASGVATAMLPGTTCPPFATCLYSARVNNNATQSLNYGVGGQGDSLGGNLGGGTFSAPQFNGHLPEQIPEHLEDGATIYFYGEVTISPPSDSLMYPDGSMNYYADGGQEVIRNGHVMTPPAPDGDIMAQRPVRVNENAKMNFDDGGIIVLPDGVTGVINGQQVRGGEIIVINHADDILVPAGTKLYPFPSGSHPAGEHVHEHNHEPYDGPPVKMPTNVAASTNNNEVPGVAQWWQN